MIRKFMITGLLAAGFGHHDPLQAALTRATSSDKPDEGKLFQLFRQDHLYTLAGHASHSSHSSHASHASHYSSTGGYSPPTYSPAPTYTPPSYSPPPPGPAPAPSPSGVSSQALSSPPPTAPALKPAPLPGRSALFKKVVTRVQVALMGRGLFNGPIDGSVGVAMRAALRQFQQSQGLTVTGTITSDTLDALHVPSQ
jgi:His-Xaa-Ser repeat protein HxsA